jgi:hypothetical protein
LIGGPTASARNVISGGSTGGFGGGGIGIGQTFSSRGFVPQISGTVIEGNYIGVDATGTRALAEQEGSFGILSGGWPALIVGNHISGWGTGIVGGTIIQGNCIGTDSTGKIALPNGTGISSGGQIGGTISGQGNIIAFNNGPGVSGGGGPIEGNSIYANAGPGVWVRGGATGDAIQGNSIHDNAGLGIVLGQDNQGNPLSTPTLNDSLGHVGANNYQNFPCLTAASASPIGTTVSGTLDMNTVGGPFPAGTTIQLDFYANTKPDRTGYGQGQTWLGSYTLTADGTANVSFNATGLAALPAGQNYVTATATDPAGNTSEFSKNLTVPSNLQLTLQSASINEGSYASLSGSFVNPNPVDTNTVVINWGDGSANTTLNLAAGVLTFTGVTHQYLDQPDGVPSGSCSISVTVTDNEGGQTSTGTSIQVNAVLPTAKVSGPGLGVPGQPRTFTFSATSPSPTDQAAGFNYAVTWGDGNTQTITATAGNGAGAAVDHIYTSPGSYTVTATATDDDGTSSAASQAISVQTVQMEGNSLAVGGTLGNDTIILTPADTTGDITVNLNGTTSFNGVSTFKPADHILVYGQSGNDTIQLVSKKIAGTTYYITVPAIVYGGGTGHEILSVTGSTANNVVIGGGGTNQITGGLGRDLLIAGLGASKLFAGSGGDILIGGWTDYDLTSTAMTYDQKLAALEGIMAEWGRSDESYWQRVANLSNSTVNNVAPNGLGQNGGYFLSSSTVHDNGQTDTLSGITAAAPLDWFFADATDIIKHNNAGEVVTTIS